VELIKKIEPKQAVAAELDLNKYRIKSTDDIKQDVYIAKIGNTNKFSKGNISVWTGAAKSKKTFAMTMLVSSMMGGIDLRGQFYSYAQNKVLWIDTEQSPYDVQKVVKRLKELSGKEDNLIMYALRPLSPAQRVEMIDEALTKHEVDVLIIDGARDLIMDINEAKESTEIVTRIMKWSYDYNIHVSTVVHQSTAGKVRGHIGTELENKAESVIKVTRQEDDINVSEIQEVYGRGKGFEPFTFFINRDGMPVIGTSDFTGFVSAKESEEVPW